VAGFLFGPVHGFMLWNVFLAAIPAVLAVVIFSVVPRRGVIWWSVFAVWVLFLPNAPYLLTDVVHMIYDIQHTRSDTLAYVILGTYGALFAFGLGSYALSLQLFRRFLHTVGRPRLVAPAILSVHALCVVAMYLGRVIRLNSWDVVTAPQQVLASVLRVPRPTTVVILATTFVIVGVGVAATVAVGDKAIRRARSLF
jgi:uncharacterized membrane protein